LRVWADSSDSSASAEVAAKRRVLEHFLKMNINLAPTFQQNTVRECFVKRHDFSRAENVREGVGL